VSYDSVPEPSCVHPFRHRVPPEDHESQARLRAVFLAQSRRFLPEVAWCEAEDGALVHPVESLLFVTFEGHKFTVHFGPQGEHYHFGAWDPAPHIPPNEEEEAAKQALVYIQEFLARDC